jgi:bla regulator protein BlaR1
MSLFSGLLSDQLIKAIGWTLFHSLWQGLIIALLFLVLYYKFRNHRAEFRYLTAATALLVLFLASTVTFIVTYSGTSSGNEVTVTNTIKETIIPVIFNTGTEATETFGSNRFQLFMQHIPERFSFIVNLWIIGLLFISLRLTGSTFIAYRYKRTNLTPVPDRVLERFSLLVQRLNVSGRVRLLGSKLVKNPMVIGYLKPVVLIPASAISHIPCEQLDAILVHELAHIMRHDFLINVFQNIVELLMFYHPVVWYLNHQIRKERENCCDDLAVAYGGSLTYARALSTVHEIQFYPKLVLTLGLKKHHLLNRVVRILKPKKMKTNVFDKLITGVVLIAAVSVILISTGATNSQEKDAEAEPVQNHTGYINTMVPFVATNVEQEVENQEKVIYDKESEHDTTLKIKDNVITRTIDDNGKVTKLKLVVKGGEVTELYVDGKKIPKEDHGNYQAEIDETLEEVAHMKHALSDARIDLEEIDWKELQQDIQESLQDVMDINIEEIRAELEEIEFPEIDWKEIQQEIQQSLEDVMESLEEIDFEELREELEDAFKDIDIEDEDVRREMEHEMQEELTEAMANMEVDKAQLAEQMDEMRKQMYQEHEAEMAEAQQEIQKSIQEMETINQEEIRAEMEKAMKEIADAEIDMELELKKIDEMIREIEKLELKEEL